MCVCVYMCEGSSILIMCTLCLTVCVYVIRFTISVHICLIVCSSVLSSVCPSVLLSVSVYLSVPPSVRMYVCLFCLCTYLCNCPSTYTTTWLYNVHCGFVRLASRCLKNCLTQSHIASFCLACLTHLTKFASSFVSFVIILLPPNFLYGSTSHPSSPSSLSLIFIRFSFLPPRLPPFLPSFLHSPF